MNMNEIAPPRISRFIGQKSLVIHNSARYVASIVGPGLVVQSHQLGSGKLMPPSHPQYADYVAGIQTAIDSNDADALCSAMMR